MARTIRNAKLDTRSARLRIRMGSEPVWVSMARGLAVGYYRPGSGGAGTWRARLRTSSGRYRKVALGVADDFAEADGMLVLSWGQAQAGARAWFDRARFDTGEEVPHRGPFTVADAWMLYLEDCQRRGV